MWKRLVECCVMCWVIGAPQPAAEARDWAAQVAAIQDSVVSLVAEDPDGNPLLACTAWYTAPGYRVQTSTSLITAAHCLDQPEFTPVLETGSYSIVWVDSVLDLALLQTTEPGRSIPLAPTVSQGQAILIYGYRGRESIVFHGIVAKTYYTFFSTWGVGHVLDTNAVSGVSGGPVIDAQGRLVGVMLGGGHPMSEYGDIGFAATVADVTLMTTHIR